MESTLFVILFLCATVAWFGFRWHTAERVVQPVFEGNWFAPWSVHLLHWGIVLLILAMTSEWLFPATPRLWYSLALWIPVFVFSSLFAYLPCEMNGAMQSAKPGQYGRWFFYGFLALSVLLTPFYLLAVWHNVSEMPASGAGELVRNLRDLALEQRDYGLLGWAFVLNKLLFVTSLYWRRELPWWALLIVVVLNILTAASIMEKGYLAFLVIVAAWLLYEQGVLKMWHIELTVLLALIGAYFFTLIRTYAETNAQDLMSFGDFFSIYVTSSSIAYCYMPDVPGVQWGENTFALMYHIMNRLGLGSFEVVQRVQPFINVPVETNTYTVMQPFYLDFGYAGVAFFAYLYGVLSGVLYRWHRQGSTWATCFYAIVLAALCTQFHQEELLGNLVQNIQYAVLAIFIAL